LSAEFLDGSRSVSSHADALTGKCQASPMLPARSTANWPTGLGMKLGSSAQRSFHWCRCCVHTPAQCAATHQTTLHSAALHHISISLHCAPQAYLRCATPRYSALLYSTLLYSTLHRPIGQHSALNHTPPHCTAPHFSRLHQATLQHANKTIHFTSPGCAALHRKKLRCAT